MPEKGVRSTYSQSPFQIYMNDNDGLISKGTAFFYSCQSDLFLITNWHNVSGRHFLTKEKLGERTPTFIQMKLASYFDDGIHFTTKAFKTDIYEDYEPKWFEHPVLGSLCDVVALPIERPLNCPNFMHHPSNLISKIRIPVKPGNPVFIIGYQNQ